MNGPATLPEPPAPTSGTARPSGPSTTGEAVGAAPASATLRPHASRLLMVLGLFCVGVAAVMLIGQWTQSQEQPWHSDALAEAKAKLLAEPKNETLKQPVRELDQRLRQAYFRGLERNRAGAWLLLGGAVVFVWLARTRFGVRSPGVPGGSDAGADGYGTRPASVWVAPDGETTRRRATATVGVLGATLLLGLGLAGGLGGVRLPQAANSSEGGTASMPREAPRVGGAPGVEPVTPKGPDAEAWSRNWPGFRGPDGSGRVASAAVPLTWNAKTGEGVLWKTPLSTKGYNSPVVWNDRVFVTGGNRQQRLVMAFDLGSGAALWSRPVTPTNQPAAEIDPPDQSGQAASTAATDGERVFAVFATGELGALDFAGNLVWHRRLDFKDNGYGHASSLVVWRDRLLIQADQGAPEDGKSVLQAVETRTGKPLWTAKRDVGGSWATPVVADHAGKTSVFTAGEPWLMAHDVLTGAEIWRAKVLGGELAPSPVFVGDRVLATSPGHAISAVRCDGTGDVTATHVAWKIEEDVPDVPTPTVVGDLMFTANTEGHVICREVATGAKLWDHAFEMEIQASPLAVGDRLYLFAQPGNVAVVKVARTFETLASFEMGEDVYATPAVVGGRFLIRTDRHLYCVGTAGDSPKGGTSDGR
ncbi:MAG: PQQ-binding-like beta-propeller repeat protein [Verrucomicrobiales bacterium]|nr:PQQ-binding-like beta-propeller repeat protein [Verrucomicrobiales bacterium]